MMPMSKVLQSGQQRVALQIAGKDYIAVDPEAPGERSDGSEGRTFSYHDCADPVPTTVVDQVMNHLHEMVDTVLIRNDTHIA